MILLDDDHPSTMMNLSKLFAEKIPKTTKKAKELVADKKDLKKQIEMMKTLIEDKTLISQISRMHMSQKILQSLNGHVMSLEKIQRRVRPEVTPRMRWRNPTPGSQESYNDLKEN